MTKCVVANNIRNARLEKEAYVFHSTSIMMTFNMLAASWISTIDNLLLVTLKAIIGHKIQKCKQQAAAAGEIEITIIFCDVHKLIMRPSTTRLEFQYSVVINF